MTTTTRKGKMTMTQKTQTYTDPLHCEVNHCCTILDNCRLHHAASELLVACEAAEKHYAILCEVMFINNPPPGALPVLTQLKAAIKLTKEET